MMAAPFAAVSLEGFAGKLADLRKQVPRVPDDNDVFAGQASASAAVVLCARSQKISNQDDS